ncbi:hypothetical protein FJT64_023967 [Amphibalanus amphitrite]|uniref:Uncharacterized protein n=1 Tax=Amphibalanus amphitrite TaxID=1232801 RepID=A0A6A4WK61_AMPAM|nr:hypothetical protein FJT64_023967 [Amphibalanus amphitrite]
MEHKNSKLISSKIFSSNVHSLVYAINHHEAKCVLPRKYERSIEESLVHILICLCNLHKGKLTHLKPLTSHLHVIILKTQTYFAQETGQEVIEVSDSAESLDDLLRRLEEVFDALVVALGPEAGMTPAQILQAQLDMHELIATIEGIEHRDIEAQTGAERIVRDVMKLLGDFGIDPQFPTSETPTALDAALEALLATLDGALEVYGPQYGLDPYTVARLEDDLATIQQHIEDIEHGRVSVTDGLVAIVDDVFNLLRDIGVPVLPAESAMGLGEKAAYLRRQLETVLGVSHSRRPALPEPSYGQIRKLESDLLALGESRGDTTLFQIVYDLNMVARQFVNLL